MKINIHALEQALHQAILDQERINFSRGCQSNTEMTYLEIWRQALAALRRGEELVVTGGKLVQSYLCHTCGNVSSDIMEGGKCPMIDCGSDDIELITSEQAWEIEHNREEG